MLQPSQKSLPLSSFIICQKNCSDSLQGWIRDPFSPGWIDRVEPYFPQQFSLSAGYYRKSVSSLFRPPRAWWQWNMLEPHDPNLGCEQWLSGQLLKMLFCCIGGYTKRLDLFPYQKGMICTEWRIHQIGFPWLCGTHKWHSPSIGTMTKGTWWVLLWSKVQVLDQSAGPLRS